MDADQQKKLRAPFEAGAVGKLPRVWCGKCRDAIKSRGFNCDAHQRSKCSDCGNNMTTAHLHLDYVGHAAITDRLLQVDPAWSWEPVALDGDGLPALDRNGGLWIRLTVAGVTRLGYGDAEGKQGGSAVKEAIGDALRNASMRFGVALDLWHKGDLHAGDDEPGQQQERSAPPQQRSNGQQQRPAAPARPAPPPASSATDKAVEAALNMLRRKCASNDYKYEIVATKFPERYDGQQLAECTDPNRIIAFSKLLESYPSHELGAPIPANGAQQR